MSNDPERASAAGDTSDCKEEQPGPPHPQSAQSAERAEEEEFALSSSVAKEFILELLPGVASNSNYTDRFELPGGYPLDKLPIGTRDSFVQNKQHVTSQLYDATIYQLSTMGALVAYVK
eukprot:6198292-Pleurochrysis_carterae.AAC.1